MFLQDAEEFTLELEHGASERLKQSFQGLNNTLDCPDSLRKLKYD